MTAHDNPWSELHPSIEIVQDELRRLRFEQAMATVRERQAFIDELTDTMKQKRTYRDTRPRKKRAYRVTRQRFVADFTAKQTLLAERILNDLANKAGGDPQRN